MIPPNAAVIEGYIKVGKQGSPQYAEAPAIGYQSMTTVTAVSVLRSKLTLEYQRNCAILTRLENVMCFHESGELESLLSITRVRGLMDSPLRWKAVMQMSLYHGRKWKESKYLELCTDVGVKSFLFLYSDIQSGVIRDSAWMQAVFDAGVIELSGKMNSLLSCLRTKNLRAY